MQGDPTRPEAQMWITSYASLHHKPGVPLYDLLASGKAERDPRMLFSWYAADFTTDPDFRDTTPEARANPSSGSPGWDPGYLDQQRLRLPAHRYRRLHLNLPGLPEGSAFQVDPVTDAVERGVARREPEPGAAYQAFVDMSGGSSDDAVLASGHRDAAGRAVVDIVMNQGPPPPFDPRKAVERFAVAFAAYGVFRVTGDKYAGETFIADFRRNGVGYDVSALTKHQLYEALEPRLNAREVALPDAPHVEQQLLGLIWRGGKIDHPAGEHDDWSNAVAGVVALLAGLGAGFEPMAWSHTRDRTRREPRVPVVARVSPPAGHPANDPDHRLTCRACRRAWASEPVAATSTLADAEHGVHLVTTPDGRQEAYVDLRGL